MYNRKATFSKADRKDLGKSLLAFLAAGESKLLKTFLDIAQPGDPWEDKLNA